MEPNNRSHSSVDPGAYPIPFRTHSVELGSRLDAIPAALRYWAVNKQRASAPWYDEMVQANDRYEEFLGTQPPEEYPVPFKEGKKMKELDDKLRYWGVHPDRASSPWYPFFVRANARYEQHLAETRPPNKFPFPPGIIHKHAGVPIEDVPQDDIWWALRPSNSHKPWYQPLYGANQRFLDNVYESRSPGSEPIWFGRRYLGLRLDQVYERKGFLRWCFNPERGESGWIYRLKDLVRRLENWRLAHPERHGPRRRRNAPNIQNPVGEAIGPWNDGPGSADEDEYDKDSFVQSDGDEIEYTSNSDNELTDDSTKDNAYSDSDESTSPSSVKTTPSVRHTGKRRRANVIVSDDEESGDVEMLSVGKLGGQYRLQLENLGEVEAPPRKSLRQM